MNDPYELSEAQQIRKYGRFRFFLNKHHRKFAVVMTGLTITLAWAFQREIRRMDRAELEQVSKDLGELPAEQILADAYDEFQAYKKEFREYIGKFIPK